MTRIRKILGGIAINGITHGIGKLENGRYAVGFLIEGTRASGQEQFDTLDAAFDHWFATFPVERLSSAI